MYNDDPLRQPVRKAAYLHCLDGFEPVAAGRRLLELVALPGPGGRRLLHEVQTDIGALLRATARKD